MIRLHQKWIFHPPFHRDSVKFNDLFLTSTSKFLQQITRFQLHRGVTDGKNNTAGLHRRPSPCSKCRVVPLCESRCEQNPRHEGECAALCKITRDDSTTNGEGVTADADLITLMRAALLRARDPGVYERVLALESNKGSKVFVK